MLVPVPECTVPLPDDRSWVYSALKPTNLHKNISGICGAENSPVHDSPHCISVYFDVESCGKVCISCTRILQRYPKFRCHCIYSAFIRLVVTNVGSRKYQRGCRKHIRKLVACYYGHRNYGKTMSLQKKDLFILCFLLGSSPASELYMPTFRNILSVPSS